MKLWYGVVMCKVVVRGHPVLSCGMGSLCTRLCYGVIMHGVVICKVVVQARLRYGVLMCGVTLKLAFVTKVEDNIFKAMR